MTFAMALPIVATGKTGYDRNLETTPGTHG